MNSKHFKGLGHQVRLDVALYVHRNDDGNGVQFADIIKNVSGCAQSTMSQHVKMMCDCGVLNRVNYHGYTARGTFYSLNYDAVISMTEAITLFLK